MQDEEDKLFYPDLQAIITTWTLQGGHPVVYIKNINETTLSLRQERFIFSNEHFNVQKYAS